MGEQIKGFSESDKESDSNRFNEALGGKFDSVQSGDFATELPGVESINIIKPQPGPDGKVNTFNVVVYYAGEKRRGTTLSFLSDGILAGSIPKGAPFTKEDIRNEVLRITEQIDLNFFTQVDDDILPPDEIDIEPGIPTGEKQRSKKLTDPRRIEFFKNRPNALFGFSGKKSGLRGYYGFVYPNRIICERDDVGNAIYEVPLRSPIVVSDDVLKRAPGERMNETERRKVLEENWAPFAGRTKTELVKMGAHKIVHPKIDDVDWEEKLSKSLDRLENPSHV